MLSSKKKHKGILLAATALLLVAVILISSVHYYRREKIEQLANGDLLAFSLSANTYADSQLLEIAAVSTQRGNGVIRYTLDSSEPSETSALYTEPIELEALPQRGCHTVRAAYFEDGQRSRVYTRSYFVGDQPVVLHEDLLVVCISGDPEGLYGEETGIFSGPELDPDVPIQDVVNNTYGYNYLSRGGEWERPVSVEIYDSAGTLLLTQNAGLRIAGQFTRIYEIKSLRLFARNGYDDGYGKFDAPFLAQQASADGNGLPVTQFNRLDLRSGSSDMYAMVDDAAARHLVRQSGFAPTPTPTPAVVYINGEYYSLLWLQPGYDEKNLADMCNYQDEESIDIVTLYMNEWESDNPAALGDFRYVYEDLMLRDLNNAEYAQELEQLVDVDNMLLYCAVQMLLNNTDWPTNNIRVYRYTGDYDPGNELTDGRWRFLFYDGDFAFNAYFFDRWIFHNLFNIGHGPQIVKLVQSTHFRTRFLNTCCTLMETALAPDNMLAVYDRMVELSRDEIYYNEQRNHNLSEHTEKRLAQYDYARENIEGSEAYSRYSLFFFLETSGEYVLDIASPPEGVAISLNQGQYLLLPEDEGFSGTYYASNTLCLDALVYDGYEFVEWKLSGQVITDPHLEINYNYAYELATLELAVVVRRAEAPSLVMTEVSYRGSDDWVVLNNPSDIPVDLGGFYLSNDPENLHKFALPQAVLAPGESLRIYSNKAAAPIGSYQFGFSLKQFETVYLSDMHGICQQVYLLDSKKGFVLQKAPYADRWSYYSEDAA